MQTVLDQPDKPKARATLSLAWWGAALRAGLDRARERVEMERKVSSVASIVVLALQKDRREAERTLDLAWEAYGSEPFERAMALECWAMGLSEQALLMSPAEACACLDSGRWTETLCAMVPSQHWGIRTKKTVRRFGAARPSWKI